MHPEASTLSGGDTGLPEGGWARRFLGNVLWNWAGVLAIFFTGFFLSPYIIRKLGDHRYGIWALAFAFIDYFTLFDFGFKSATANLIARARVESNFERINQIVNTSLFYFIGIGGALLALTCVMAGHLDLFLKITPEYRDEFATLVRLIAGGWATAIALNVFNAAMEAFQQFKAQNLISGTSMLARAGGCATAVWLGYGLPTMGAIVLASQVAMFVSLGLAFRRAFPALRISPRLMRAGAWKDLAGYGVHAFVASVATILLNQGPPLAVGHFWAESFVGYYTLPARLLQNMVDLITRTGNVTMPSTAELSERGRTQQIVALGTYLNRYCFALFVPFGLFLLAYGPALIRRWIEPGFASQAAPLLVPFVLMTTLAVAGQFNSSTILFGLARHAVYARSLLLEAVASLAVMSLVLPRFGIIGGAWVVAGFGLLNRGLVTPYLLSRELRFSLFGYLRDIYFVPAALLIPEAAYCYLLRRWLAGRGWTELILAFGLIATPHYLSCWFTIVDKSHRAVFQDWLRRSLGQRRDAALRGVTSE